jgi:hypothetical protein
MWDFINLLVSFALGALTVALTEWYKGPKVRIELGPPADVPGTGGLTRRFVQVNVVNRPAHSLLRRVFTREAANNCFGTIEFQHLNGDPLFPRIDGRWSASLEIPQVVQPNSMFSPNLIEPLRFRAVYSNRPELLTIAVKWANEDECHGFNNMSYFHQRFQNPAWTIQEGVYRVHVEINFSGEVVERTFLLRNPRDINGFCLEVLPEG